MSTLTVKNAGALNIANRNEAANAQIANVNTDKTIQKASSSQSASRNRQVSPGELKRIINKINENVSLLNKDVKFVYNDSIKSLVVKVIDAKTGKVIREIPPKEVINLQKKLSEIVGIIFDSKEVK